MLGSTFSPGSKVFPQSEGTRKDCVTVSESAGEKQISGDQPHPPLSFEAPPSLRVSVASPDVGELTRFDQARLAACALSYATPYFPIAPSRTPSTSTPLYSSSPLTLVLDLDETCVRSMANYVLKSSEDHSAETMSATVFYRPFLVPMLRALRALNVEVVVFTASHQTYSDSILNVIDPNRELITERYYRQHTVPHSTLPDILCKDLTILGRNPNRCLLIDDLAESAAPNPLNAWTILPYSKALRFGAVSNVIGRRHHEARFRKYCAPVLLHPSQPGLPRSVLGVQQPDFALLNLFVLIKVLLRSGSDVPTFTQKYKAEIAWALTSETTRMWLPGTSAK